MSSMLWAHFLPPPLRLPPKAPPLAIGIAWLVCRGLRSQRGRSRGRDAGGTARSTQRAKRYTERCPELHPYRAASSWLARGQAHSSCRACLMMQVFQLCCCCTCFAAAAAASDSPSCFRCFFRLLFLFLLVAQLLSSSLACVCWPLPLHAMEHTRRTSGRKARVCQQRVADREPALQTIPKTMPKLNP